MLIPYRESESFESKKKRHLSKRKMTATSMANRVDSMLADLTKNDYLLTKGERNELKREAIAKIEAVLLKHK